MAYDKFYQDGFKPGIDGGTPWNHQVGTRMEQGIKDAHDELANKAPQTDVDNLSTQMADLAGVGRTTENVKKNADDIANKLDASNYTAADVLTKLKTVDGSGSGLDADTVDGWQRDTIRDWNNILNKPSTFTPSTHNHDSDYTNIVYGSYIGDDTFDSATPREIVLGFQPKAVIVMNEGYIIEPSNSPYTICGGLAVPGVPVGNIAIDISSNGFNVYRDLSKSIKTNYNSSKYTYIAFK